jgi:hypothetical protein
MKEIPILFSTPMVKAILAGNKTQTRRIIKPQYSIKEKYKIGDVLWVRETYRVINHSGHGSIYFYKADACFTDLNDKNIKWKPSIFMPKEACRIKLKITDIKVERLQDISEQDAIHEGIEFKEWNNGFVLNKGFKIYGCRATYDENPIVSYRSLWEQINGKDSWNINHWVWVIQFERI